jgi:WD40 repeat protein
VLLALEAHRRAPGSETEQAVLNALGSSRIPNRVVAFPGFDLGDCSAGSTYHSQDGLTAYMHVGGRFLILDLATGQITEQAVADEECGVWYGDLASKRTAAIALDFNRSWVGTFDDPYAIELEQTGQMWLPNTDLGSNVAGFVTTRGADNHDAVVLFDATTGEQIGEPIGEGSFWRVVADPSGSFVAISEAVRDPEIDVADGVGRLHVLDATTGDELHQIETTVPAASITFDPTTRELIAGMADGGVMTVDLDSGAITSTVATSAAHTVLEVGVRPDGLIVAVTAGQIEVLDRRFGPIGVVTEVRDLFDARVRDDGFVVTRDTDNQYAVVDIDGSALVERSWQVSSIARIAFADGQAGVVNRASQEVSVVDLASGEQTDLELRDREGNRFVVDGVYPERDGVWAVGDRGDIARWEGDTLVERIDIPDGLFKWRRFGDMIAAIRPDADDNQVASLISVERDAAGIRFTVSAPLVNSVHPALDGGLYVFNVDGSLDIYDAEGEATGRIETGARFTADATMDPSTGRLAVGTSAGVIVIEPLTGEVEQLPGKTSVANFGFARDGQLLVISGFDGTVRVWDLDRGEPAGLVWDGTGVASSFSPSWYDSSSDSIWVFTSGRLIEVPLDPRRWVERACDIVGRDLTRDEWVRYVPGANDAEDVENAQALRDEPVPHSACT